jgi:hypothetical protein
MRHGAAIGNAGKGIHGPTETAHVLFISEPVVRRFAMPAAGQRRTTADMAKASRTGGFVSANDLPPSLSPF